MTTTREHGILGPLTGDTAQNFVGPLPYTCPTCKAQAWERCNVQRGNRVAHLARQDKARHRELRARMNDTPMTGDREPMLEALDRPHGERTIQWDAYTLTTESHAAIWTLRQNGWGVEVWHGPHNRLGEVDLILKSPELVDLEANQ